MKPLLIQHGHLLDPANNVDEVRDLLLVDGKVAGTAAPKDAKPSTHKAAKRWTAAEVFEAFSRFRKANPEPKGELEHLNPFTLLVAVVLSAQATDAGVNRVTPALFATYPTPAALASATTEDVERIVHATGFFRQKAKAIRGPGREKSIRWRCASSS